LSASFWRALIFMIGVNCLGGCGTLPDSYALMHDRRMYRRHFKVVSSQGPLSASESKVIIQNLEARSGKTDILTRHLAFEQAISGSPLMLGNQVTLLENGGDTYRAMFGAIEGATRNINLETYLFDGDRIGDRFANALIAKQQQGVQVNIIYDGFGSMLTHGSFFKRMRDAGIQVVEFDPLNPFAAGFHWAPIHRDHRKLMIVDGRIAITGGINISGVYSSRHSLRRRDSSNSVLNSWRDTDVQVEGPAVSEFQELFFTNWRNQGGAPLKVEDYFPAPDNKGDQIVRVLGSVPQDFSTIYVTLISAIRNAETNVYITDAYFAPDSQMLESLETAARRGVDVRLLLPGKTDQPLIGPAARAHFSELLDAGVKIYLWQGQMLHAKTATIDGVWSTVGSSNLDYGSIARNDEINTVVLSLRFGDQMNESFMRDLKNSEQIDATVWEQRSALERIDEAIARSLKPML
jgi:cardiolipin synthase A/B